VDTLTAYLLVLVNLVFQGVLLYAVFYRVVIKTNEWRSEITQFGPVGQMSLFAEPLGECNTGNSLCLLEGNNVTCAPPSVQLTSRWDELDLNGDGMWTRQEVLQARDALKCKYAVDPLEVFDVFVKTVLNREDIIWVHPDLRAGKVIHKPYFTYASGDVIMCGYRNQDMCGNLFQQGFFDAALEFNTVPRVGNTIESARKYCSELLKPGGFCDMTLPSTYSVWKIESAQECKKPKYGKFVYEHPKTEVQKSFLAVDYSARQDVQTTKTPLFQVFLFIILSLWVMAMVYEMKRILVVWTWIATFKSDTYWTQKGEEAVLMEVDEDENTSFTIRGISSDHRRMVAIITLVRTFMLMVLLVVGMSLLLKSTSYQDLVMDAVSLVFIMEIAEILYYQVLRPQIRQQVEGLAPMTIEPEGLEWLNSRPALIDLLWLAVVFAVVMVVMIGYQGLIVDPLYQALQCTCIGEGSTCREANAFNYGFWHNYWKHDTPAIFNDVEVLKQSSGSMAFSIINASEVQNHEVSHQIIQKVTKRTSRHRHRSSSSKQSNLKGS